VRVVFYLIQKEFRQIFRDHFQLRIILFVPLMMLLVLGNALILDLKNVDLAIVDLDHTAASRELIRSFYASDIFRPAKHEVVPSNVETSLQKGLVDMVVWIPEGYARNILRGESASVGIFVDGSNANTAGQGGAYALAIIQEQSTGILQEKMDKNPRLAKLFHTIKPISRFIYNPELKSRYYMIPGIVVMIITVISGLISGMGIVREKEMGTLEQLMVTPITSTQLILGKLLPSGILAFFDMGLAIIFATLVFKLTIVGSLWLLFLSTLLYLMVTLGVGLLASTLSQTQQQAMLTVWFFLVFGILTSGFFYPLENMPPFVQTLTVINPLRYFMSIMRGIFVKGVLFSDILPDLGMMTLQGIIVLGLAINRYTKTAK